ncbi:nuclear receptor coactivator 7 isoform X1 [Microcaecilia unicolor]|uniref:Nuclear receptor coactivator 7 isoform X1 n=1 Tax=Microcaecilia unicolor TaxID=1415580 RepID=A0A6P7XP84_9AMPH|nr:nuclear receptor coactivator 7 isoform X1 [Microcaecilia unicolor]
MDTKEEKKERRQGYFARLKKKRQAKQNTDVTPAIPRGSTTASRTQAGKPDAAKVILEQLPSSHENPKLLPEKETADEDKKKKKSQVKQIRCTDLKRYYNTDDNQKKSKEKKEKKMVAQKPLGTIGYTAEASDTLNSIALKFNVTPNKLVVINKLFTRTIVPGQVLYVPDINHHSSASLGSSPGCVVSPVSSDAEYDKLPDADLARRASKPLERVVSSTSEEEEPLVVKFLKMNCRYITDGKGVVGGVMIVTPNNVMFDPHKSDPLVIENGCEEYGLICPMDEVVSIALYSDISHMKLKDALPSPGEWEDLSSEKDINPFSRFKSRGKEKKQLNGSSSSTTLNSKTGTPSDTGKPMDSEVLKPKDGSAETDSKTVEPFCGNLPMTHKASKPSDECPAETGELPVSTTKDQSVTEKEEFTELEEPFSHTRDKVSNKNFATAGSSSGEPEESRKSKLQLSNTEVEGERPMLSGSGAQPDCESQEVLYLEKYKKEESLVPQERCSDSSPVDQEETLFKTQKKSGELEIINSCLSKKVEESLCPQQPHTTEVCENGDLQDDGFMCSCSELLVGGSHTSAACRSGKDRCNAEDGLAATDEKVCAEPLLSSSSEETVHEMPMDSESEIKLWLMKKIQGPIEDMLPSREEKSKMPPMFLCIKVGKPMRKSFPSPSTTMVQQYPKKRKQPEYWFAVPQERVDHLYTFFVQWSPEVYGKDAKEQGFVVVDKDELDMVDNFFSEPTTKSWEIITVEEAKRRQSTCSICDEEADDLLPDLKHHSGILEDVHVEKLAQSLPARVQGYPWQLMYSTLEHGTSLKTLYRNLASLDSPVLLVVKDMDNQVFGAYATHPFKLSDHYYGTGETFLYTFCPEFKVFKWSGENSYFINGDISSLELGGGGGKFGLWLDADLYHGRSNSCSTFNNEILSKKEDFIVQDVEVWTFE